MGVRIKASQYAANQVRSHMAWQKKTGIELGQVLGVSQQSASRRVSGEQAFSIDELFVVSEWLDQPMSEFMMPRDKRSDQVAA
jgi:transcriptional regulator with XRE-family HTH domain